MGVFVSSLHLAFFSRVRVCLCDSVRVCSDFSDFFILPFAPNSCHCILSSLLTLQKYVHCTSKHYSALQTLQCGIRLYFALPRHRRHPRRRHRHFQTAFVCFCVCALISVSERIIKIRDINATNFFTNFEKKEEEKKQTTTRKSRRCHHETTSERKREHKALNTKTNTHKIVP